MDTFSGLGSIPHMEAYIISPADAITISHTESYFKHISDYYIISNIT
jgi:hypothetical protein